MGKTGFSLDDLCGVAGAAPQKATGVVLLEGCLLRYSDIFGDESDFEFANYQQELTSLNIVVLASSM